MTIQSPRLSHLFGLFCFATLLFTGANLLGQTDPGPRPGAAGAGGPYPTLNSSEQTLFDQALIRFSQLSSVKGAEPGAPLVGLGPGFNGNGCSQCHSQPSTGGAGIAPSSPQNSTPNPQIQMAADYGATNTIPSFITADGPVRETRFVTNSDGTLDGGVHDVFTIAGRSDAVGCTLAQPNYVQELAANNVRFRIPISLFGDGLIDNTPDSVLYANLAANASKKAKLGIAGVFNTSGNDGTITKFGWKAQNKSLLVFAAEASNVELGVSNENFPNERNAVPGCIFNPTPEDFTPPEGTGSVSEASSNLTNLAAFIRLSAPPATAPLSTTAKLGQALFSSVGCVLCHSDSLTTAASQFTGMGNVTYSPFSDLALHNMGVGLADGITQGGADGNHFRTAPLWGVGQRLFFLHDGRESDLLKAIQDHSSTGSEANGVIQNFNKLSTKDQQAVLNFLRDL
jgi:CxxC motif-containing protein (DUF1111 family)